MKCVYFYPVLFGAVLSCHSHIFAQGAVEHLRQELSQMNLQEKQKLLAHMQALESGVNAQILSYFEHLTPKQQQEVLAQLNANKNKAVPSVKWDTETYDFGDVQEGESLTKIFVVTNTGNAPLSIHDAKSNCGCTVPKFPKHPVEPGQSDKVVVSFDSSNKLGMVDQNVVVYDNSSPNQRSILKIKANVLVNPKKKKADTALTQGN
jgi:Protein of unknown function (DUF1573)